MTTFFQYRKSFVYALCVLHNIAIYLYLLFVTVYFYKLNL